MHVSHNALSTVLGTEQNRQGLIHMEIIIRWGDRQNINTKPWKVTTTAQISRRRECVHQESAPGEPGLGSGYQGRSLGKPPLGSGGVVAGVKHAGAWENVLAESPVREGSLWGGWSMKIRGGAWRVRPEASGLDICLEGKVPDLPDQEVGRRWPTAYFPG